MSIRAAGGGGGEDPGDDREGPAGGDGDPAGILALGLAEKGPRDDAVAEDDQHHRSEELAEEGGGHEAVPEGLSGVIPGRRRRARNPEPLLASMGTALSLWLPGSASRPRTAGV